ncbi:MAG: DUF1566 domain-containing protein [Sulfurospirillum sp.]|nr:DUF1566 domain-containing protein [Sulfurospirillum sp.]
MTSFIKFFFISIFLFALIGCGSDESHKSPESTKPDTGTQKDTIIIAIDGYIKDANLKDADDQKGTYSSKGKYTFANEIKYPLTLKGGSLEDTDAVFDIALKSERGLVISPITSFVENNATLRTELENFFGEILEIDYIEQDDRDLAKLSQLLYVMHRDKDLLSAFKSSVALESLTKLEDFFEYGKIDINRIFSKEEAKNYIDFLNVVFELNMPASEYENALKLEKAALGILVGVVKTGQTKSYHENDDGHLERGITRSYTDNNNSTITDNATTLMWQNEDYDKKDNWKDANDYCTDLNLSNKSDWRLPTIAELMSIVDLNKTNSPTIDDIFTNTDKHSYWSSTTDANNNNNAWLVDFRYNNKNYRKYKSNNYSDYKGYMNSVRCVR